MIISIVTLFPQMFDGPFHHSIVHRAQEKKLVDIRIVNLRDFGIGNHQTVDDTPYGGGTGMVLRVDVVHNAIEKIKAQTPAIKPHTVLLDARGTPFTQKKAQQLSTLDHVILIAGHYEGFDERILNFIDEQISIGDYILTGGEIPCMAITDAIVRLIPSVIKDDATLFESFSLANDTQTSLLEYPHYTKPQTYNDHSVPQVLLNGNHGEIEKWRMEQAERVTQTHRPDLLKSRRAA